MDTFMDKLAQKLTAQEMIKANSAADAAELAKVREQAAEYESILKEMKAESGQNAENLAKVAESAAGTADNVAKTARNAEVTAQNAEVVAENAAKVAENAARTAGNAAKVQELVEAAIAKIEEMQAGSRDTEELQQLLESLKALQTQQAEELTDHVHKENVKVYRNVQAVVVEEAAKQNETLGRSIAAVSSKVKAVLGISIVALIAACAGVAFQVLVYFHIL